MVRFPKKKLFYISSSCFPKCLSWCEHVGTQVVLVISVDGCSTAGRQEDEHIVSVTHSCSYTSIHHPLHSPSTRT